MYKHFGQGRGGIGWMGGRQLVKDMMNYHVCYQLSNVTYRLWIEYPLQMLFCYFAFAFAVERICYRIRITYFRII